MMVLLCGRECKFYDSRFYRGIFKFQLFLTGDFCYYMCMVETLFGVQ
jgi:hypothetical protein